MKPVPIWRKKAWKGAKKRKTGGKIVLLGDGL
jgi:hypothetical protein